jgi:hypothetical protein
MRLSAVPLTAADLPRCAPMWGGRELLTAAQLRAALATLGRLLTDGHARGRLFVDDSGDVCAFGCSAFVSTSFADALVARPQQLFGSTLLLRPDVEALVLDDERVAAGNAGRGLDLVVVSQGYRTRRGSIAAEEFTAVLGAMIHAFVDTHLGYNVERIVNEVFGAEGMAAIESASAGGLDLLARFRPEVDAGVLVPSLIWTLTRAQAHTRRSLLLPMFLYAPPRLGFTTAERALLLSALGGRTDRESAVALGIPLTAVKARWTRILARAADQDPRVARGRARAPAVVSAWRPGAPSAAAPPATAPVGTHTLPAVTAARRGRRRLSHRKLSWMS